MFPIHLDLGFTKFHFYEGIYFLIAILTGVLLSARIARKNGINQDDFYSFAIWVILGAIVGGRVSNYIFWSTDQLLTKPWTIFFVWQGGISITGGIGGGILAGWIYSRVKKFPFWKLFAMISPVVLLSQAIGRIGCFLNGDAHGIASSLPWAVRFPRYGRYFPSFKLDKNYSSFPWTWSYEHNLVTRDTTLSAPLHPTQIYEMLLDLLLMGFIIFLYKIVKARNLSYKLIFFAHVGIYSFYRFFLEFIRADRTGITAIGISYMQFVLAGIFLLSVFFSIFLLVRKPKAGSVKTIQ